MSRINRLRVLFAIVHVCRSYARALSSIATSSDASCDDDNTCRSITCITRWWRNTNIWYLVGATVLVFFATFLPRVLVSMVVFVLTKIPFIAQTAEDFRQHCSGSSAYLVSSSLVLLGAISISGLSPFLCKIHIYIWGLFFLFWIYSLFNVAESLAIRRFVGSSDDFSKRVVISESIKILRLTTLLIISLIIYSSALGQEALVKYSVLAVIGLAIALGFVPSFHNVVGGLFLAFNSQFKIGDFIQVADARGFVHRVSLRYTTIMTLEGTKTFIPNSFFLFKPMINFSQRPKRDIDIRVRVPPTTPVVKLRECLLKLETMLQSLHVGLTSHEENQSDLRHGEKWERFYFVAMEKLFEIRVYSFTDELDERKYAMIRSEVWFAIMEIMEEMGIEVVDDAENAHNEELCPHWRQGREEIDRSPFQSEMNFFIGSSPRTN